jgi:DNA-binding CsgD family transcriptional regulator
MTTIRLTNREKELLRHISENRKTQQIAKSMGITASTVNVMKSNIRRSIGAGADGPVGLYLWAVANKKELK